MTHAKYAVIDDLFDYDIGESMESRRFYIETSTFRITLKEEDIENN